MKAASCKKSYRRRWAMWALSFTFVGIVLAVVFVASELLGYEAESAGFTGLTLLVTLAGFPFYFLALQWAGFEVHWNIELLEDKPYEVVIVQSFALMTGKFMKHWVLVDGVEVLSRAGAFRNLQVFGFQFGTEPRHTAVARINMRYSRLTLEVDGLVVVS